MTIFRRYSAIPALAALVFSVSGSLAAAANTWNTLTQYQYVTSSGSSDSTLTRDWFAGVNGYYQTGTAGTVTEVGAVLTSPATNSTNVCDFSGSSYSNVNTVSGVNNYTSKAPITNATLLSNGAAFYTGNPAAAGTNPNFYVAGTGLTYVAQNRNNTFANANGSNLRMRNQNVELGATAGTTSQGITYLGYTTLSQPTTLSSGSFVFALALGASGADTGSYNPGFRAAIQDTSGQWWLSAWATGKYTGTPGGTGSGVPFTLDMNTGAYALSYGASGTAMVGTDFVATGTTPGWYQYTPATSSSGALSLLDTATAPFSATFTGTAQAFGFYFGQTGVTSFRARGFEVLQSPAAVPEPATVGMTALGLGALVAARATRHMRRRS